ncbi:hypothetical protein ACTA71_002898 [Dictyostelium dimigraforme]
MKKNFKEFIEKIKKIQQGYGYAQIIANILLGTFVSSVILIFFSEGVLTFNLEKETLEFLTIPLLSTPFIGWCSLLGSLLLIVFSNVFRNHLLTAISIIFSLFGLSVTAQILKEINKYKDIIYEKYCKINQLEYEVIQQYSEKILSKLEKVGIEEIGKVVKSEIPNIIKSEVEKLLAVRVVDTVNEIVTKQTWSSQITLAQVIIGTAMVVVGYLCLKSFCDSIVEQVANEVAKDFKPLGEPYIETVFEVSSQTVGKVADSAYDTLKEKDSVKAGSDNLIDFLQYLAHILVRVVEEQTKQYNKLGAKGSTSKTARIEKLAEKPANLGKSRTELDKEVLPKNEIVEVLEETTNTASEVLVNAATVEQINELMQLYLLIFMG